MKESFVLFTEHKEIINKLSNEQAGIIFKAIFDYCSDNENLAGIENDLAMDIVYTTLKQTIERNNEKWEETKQRRSDAGKRGAEKRWQSTTNDSEVTKDDGKNGNAINRIVNDGKNGNAINDMAKMAVSVSDSVSVNVSVNKEKDKRESDVSVDTPPKPLKPKKIFIPPTLNEVEEYISEKKLNVDAKKFFDYFETGNWIDSKGNKVKNWKQKVLTWNSHTTTSPPEPTNKYRDDTGQYSKLDDYYMW